MLPGVSSNESVLELLVRGYVRAELFTGGMIATFALLPVWLTSHRDKDRQ